MKIRTPLYAFILFILSVFVLSGCGGGGGGSNSTSTTPTDPAQSFSLASLQSTTVGTVYSAQLTGSDSDGVSFSGSLSMANRTQIMLGGVLVTPSDMIFSLTGGGGSVTVTGTSYVDTSGNLISLYLQTTGMTCTPVSPDSMPLSVKIGDFGILSTFTCSDNTTQERSWRVEDAGNGNIRIISNGTSKDRFNTITDVTDVIFTIDGGGNIIAFKTVTTLFPSNYTLTLNAK